MPMRYYILVIMFLFSASRLSSTVNYRIPRTVQYSFTLTNTTDHVIKDAEFWTYAPVPVTATQTCQSLIVSEPYESIMDPQGNHMLHFKIPTMPPRGHKTISVRAQLLLSREPVKLPVKGAYRTACSLPAPFVESDDADIRAQAKALASGTALVTARRIVEWVSAAVKYAGYTGNERGARYAIKNKSGDCTEYMRLVEALCRADGIPARGMAGYICSESGILNPARLHNWVECLLDGYWMAADAQNNRFAGNMSDYIAIKILDGSTPAGIPDFNRYHCKGDGLEARIN